MRILRNLTFLSANFYISGMASRATKEEDVAFMYRRTTKKEKPLGGGRQAEERWDKIHYEDRAYFTPCPWRV